MVFFWITALQDIQKNTTLTTILPGHGNSLKPTELALPLRFLKTIQEMTNSSPDKPVGELIPLFPAEVKQQYQLDEVGERAFSMFLEAGLKQSKLSK